MKRDIKRDRETCEVLAALHDNISRNVHLERMVDAAIDLLIEITGGGPSGMEIPTSRTGILPSDRAFRYLWRDYLDQKAKEGEGNGR